MQTFSDNGHFLLNLITIVLQKHQYTSESIVKRKKKFLPPQPPPTRYTELCFFLQNKGIEHVSTTIGNQHITFKTACRHQNSLLKTFLASKDKNDLSH